MSRLPIKDPAEVVVIAFDFSAELLAETITGSPIITCTAYQGVDASPGAVIYGAPAVVGQTVTQTVCAGLDGIDYKLRGVITTSGGRTLVLSGILPVRVL
jgi:hypothetical protein